MRFRRQHDASPTVWQRSRIFCAAAASALRIGQSGMLLSHSTSVGTGPHRETTISNSFQTASATGPSWLSINSSSPSSSDCSA